MSESPTVEFFYDKRRNIAKIVSHELLSWIRTQPEFVWDDPNARFVKKFSKYAKTTHYAIGPMGNYNVGLTIDIIKTIKKEYTNANIKFNDDILNVIRPNSSFSGIQIENTLSFPIRDYQNDTLKSMYKSGRGIIELGTGGGKTFIFANFLNLIYKHKSDLKCLIIVPSISLVEQCYKDFIDYGCNFTFSKFSGDNKLNLNVNVIIAGEDIINTKRKKSPKEIDDLYDVNYLLIDEVHELTHTVKLNDFVKQIKTHNKFGFTGSLPKNPRDVWNIFGNIGSLIYSKPSIELRDEGYLSPVEVKVIKLSYEESPVYKKYDETDEDSNTVDNFNSETSFISESEFRNNVLYRICNSLDNNILILVNRIEHGNILTKYLTEKLPNKKIEFIHGGVDVEDRERVRTSMETNNNIVCVAITKVFATGINVKNLHYIFFAGFGKSYTTIVQGIGRGLRKHESKSKLIVFDVCDNLRYSSSHMLSRIEVYEEEKIPYSVVEFNEFLQKQKNETPKRQILH